MTWKDIDINFEKQHDGDIQGDHGINAIYNSIGNIFNTMQGSRRMVPSFAMPVYNLLFEQLDAITMSSLEDMLLMAIERWEDRIYVNYLKAIADHDNNRIDIKLEFRLRHDVEDKVFNINQNLVMQG